MAQKLVLENEGILPSYTWLMKNGYAHVRHCISNNKEVFKGIKQENKVRKEGFKIIGE